MHAKDRAADVSGFRVPNDVIPNLESFRHDGSSGLWRSLGALLEGRLAFLGHDPLELDLRQEAFAVPVDDGHRQFLIAASVGDRAVSRLELAVDVGLVPSLGVTRITEAEIVLLGPEERHVIETFAAAEDVVRGGLTLTLGDAQCSTRMLSPVSRSGQRAMSPAAKMPGTLVWR
jgi:hypothetical protein